ncbi:MAG: 4a-hydroxytetrahydrobiopterin dehydratase [Janthinobacterium sp.]|jgi:4a-hydroxytetrahydrobiopterin dehydratase
MSAPLLEQHCSERLNALSEGAAAQLLQQVPLWAVEHGKLCRTFAFKNYHHTMAFVDALAAMIHQQDHHPELTVTYNKCTVRYDTHSVDQGRGGLSENDFICAARADDIEQSMLQQNMTGPA